MVTDWFNENLGTPFAASPLPYLYHPYVGSRQQPRHVHVHAEGKPVHGGAGLARLVPVGVAGRASDGQQRSAHVRDAGDRSDQPERSSADLPVERHPRPVAGGGARGGRQGRHHLQLDLHELLAGGAGVERVVAQPDRPAHRGGERPHRDADPAARVRIRHERLSAPTAGRGSADVRVRRRAAPAAHRRHAAHRVSAALDGRPLDAPRHRGLRAHRDDGAARNGGRSPRNDPASDLRGQPADGRGRQERGGSGDPHPRCSAARRAGSRASRRSAHARRRRSLSRRIGVRGRRPAVWPPERSSSR